MDEYYLIIELTIRLLVAGILGALVGFDRERQAKEAGYRTHFLVAVGSALMMIISQYGFLFLDYAGGIEKYDPSRIAAQVVSGIGFIGAGTIILQRNQIVRGLTTAAGLWATAGIGLAIGGGMYWMGIITTILVICGITLLNHIFKKVGYRTSAVSFTTGKRETVELLLDYINKKKEFIIISYQMELISKINGEIYSVDMIIKANRENAESPLAFFRREFPEILITKVE
jgi:mgtC family protein